MALPLVRPVAMAGETVAVARNMIVQAADGEGNVGWGEAAAAPLMTGETQPGMLAAARFAIKRLIGREILSVDDVAGLVSSTIPGNPGVKAALEMAILDLAGRRLGKPLFELLGGRVRNRAPIVTLLAAEGQESEVEQVRRSLDAGVRAFKVKVGLADVASDLARCREIRDAAGSGPRVSADANGGFDEASAIAFAKAAGDAGLDFVEQPVPPGSLDAMRACVESSSVPIGADEGFQSEADIISHYELQAASGGSLKPLKLGILNLVTAGRLMNRLGMHVNLAGKVAESSIASAAISHLAVALPQLDWDASPTNQYLAEDLASEPVTVIDGAIEPMEVPGLGVTVDGERLEKLRVT